MNIMYYSNRRMEKGRLKNATIAKGLDLFGFDL